MKRAISGLATAALIFSLSACGSDAGYQEPQDTPSHADRSGYTVVEGGDDAYDVELQKVNVDGTDCVVANSYHGPALSCNWTVTQ